MLNIKHFLEHDHCARGYSIIGNDSSKNLKVFGSKTLLKHRNVRVAKQVPEWTPEGKMTA